jgi:branched-chain amino acid transport system substrate-binding protein
MFIQISTLVLILSFVLSACAAPTTQVAPTEAPTEAPAEAPTEVKPAATTAPASGEPILIGWSGPLTGPFVNEGLPMKDAFQLAVDEWNAKGGVLGRPIKTLIIDDQVSVEPAVAGAQMAVQQGAVAVIGWFFSNVAVAARPTLLNNNIIFAPAGVNDIDVVSTAEKPELVFRTTGLAAEEAGLTAKYMLDVLGLRKVAVLHDRDAWGRDQAQIVYDAVKAYPGGQALMFEGVTIGETDFSGIGTKILASGADSVYFGGHYQEMSGLLNYLRDAGWKGQFLAPDSLRSDFPKLAGKNAEGSIFLEGAGPTMIPTGKDFVKSFTAKYPNDVLSEAAMSTYVSTHLILQGIEAVGNTTDRAAIVNWIRTGPKDTIKGKIGFGPAGEIEGTPWAVQQWQKDKWVVLAFYNYETQKFDPVQ